MTILFKINVSCASVVSVESWSSSRIARRKNEKQKVTQNKWSVLIKHCYTNTIGLLYGPMILNYAGLSVQCPLGAHNCRPQ